ncbi:MAG: glycosyltransferase [Anaerolineales bacterium]|nr:glycosyltransferase [Anaerolineales bacterium]
MSIKYSLVDNVRLTYVAEKLCFINETGGKVFTDRALADIWEFAQGKPLPDIIDHFGDSLHKNHIRAALSCLVAAHFLSRFPDKEYPSKTIHDQLPAGQNGLVSVIIVAYQGVQWLAELLPSIYAQTYSPVEIIIIDNASPSREMAEWIQDKYPDIQFIRQEQALSFAAANNLGVKNSRGEYLMLLNQDTKLDKDAFSQLVIEAKKYPCCAAVAAKLRLLWAPQFINGIGNIVHDHSWGADIGFGNLDLGQFDTLANLPSACFAGALIRKSAWDEIGEIDEGFPMYYEDSEWCYRARLLGYRIVPAPNAVIYHAFGGKIPSGDRAELSPKKFENVCYGRLRFAYKLLDEETRDEVLSNYDDEDIHNFIANLVRGRIKHALAILRARRRFGQSKDDIAQIHSQLTARQAIHPSALMETIFEEPPVFEYNGVPTLTMSSIKNYYLPLILNGRTNITMPEFSSENNRRDILIVSHDIIASKMAGTGVRYLEIARALSEWAEVTLAVPQPSNLEEPSIKIVAYDESIPESLQVLVENHEQSLISGYMALKFPFLEKIKTKLIVDLYDPFFLENFYYYTDLPMEEQEKHNQVAIQVVNKLAKMGDYFICGNERQRDLWLGVLSANGRVNPRNLSDDDTLRQLIDIVGIGFPDRAPSSPRRLLRGIHPDFCADEKIVLWGGGIWNWLDPITLVKAWPSVITEHPNARLVFLGTRHPNPKVPQHEIVQRLIQEAELTGEKEKSIFFIEWLSYEEREALLLESDIGVTLHAIHAETRYSIRTRVMDYFWAGLPVIITEGDITSEWVKTNQLGVVVPPNDAQATADAIIHLLDKGKDCYKPSFKSLQEQLTWKNVVEPLRNYIFHGKNAPDRQAFYRSMREDPSPTADELLIRNPFKKAMYLWATKGFRSMVKQTIIHIKFLLSKK